MGAFDLWLSKDSERGRYRAPFLSHQTSPGKIRAAVGETVEVVKEAFKLARDLDPPAAGAPADS